MLVLFQNLLEEKLDLQYGLLMDEQWVCCLCGCEGRFEKGDYHVIRKYPNANISAAIWQHLHGHLHLSE